MKQLATSTIEKRLDKVINDNKFLSDSKYHKNNYWSWAHYSSSVAKGYCGGCSYCNAKSYIANLKNKRHNSNRKKQQYQSRKQIGHNFCSECVKLLEVKVGVSFHRIYAP